MTGINITVGALLLIGSLAAFFVTVVLFPFFIRAVRELGMGKRIRVDGPQSHYSKEGTPTMGGLLIILVVGGLALVLELLRRSGVAEWGGPGSFIDAGTFAPLATLALVGFLGTADDWLNARTGDGIRARHKLFWQIIVAIVIAYQVWDTYAIRNIAVPFLGLVAIDWWLYIPFAAFAIVATSNAVNITDGLDGLAGGLLVFAFIGFMVIAALNTRPVQPNLAILCAIIIGALLGFLWFNSHPAQVFMGDSGALGLGAALAVVALITGQVMLLPVIGLVFVLETVQDIAQIVWIRWKGRRLFRMAPLHHHFELAGWPEEKITIRFWIVGALSALIGVAFYLGTRATLTTPLQ